ncbi:MAG: hypothetical protein R3E79_09355 [Caldilineaceae bacterium]
MDILKRPFGVTTDQQPADLYTLTNDHGMTAQIMTYGGTIVSLQTPDRNGVPGDVVLGFDTLADYQAQPLLWLYYGALRQSHCQWQI